MHMRTSDIDPSGHVGDRGNWRVQAVVLGTPVVLLVGAAVIVPIQAHLAIFDAALVLGWTQLAGL
jgi:hypothetical protein